MIYCKQYATTTYVSTICEKGIIWKKNSYLPAYIHTEAKIIESLNGLTKQLHFRPVYFVYQKLWQIFSKWPPKAVFILQNFCFTMHTAIHWNTNNVIFFLRILDLQVVVSSEDQETPDAINQYHTSDLVSTTRLRIFTLDQLIIKCSPISKHKAAVLLQNLEKWNDFLGKICDKKIPDEKWISMFSKKTGILIPIKI